MRKLESSEESAPSRSMNGVYLVAVSASLVLLLSGCKATPEAQSLTLEEAKEVAIELEDTALAAPPRSLAGLGDLPNDIHEIAEAPACVVPSERLTQARVDEITRGLTGEAGRHQLLRYKAGDQERVGHLSNAILLQRESIRQTPAGWASHQAGHRFYLSRLLAQVGEFGEAEKHLAAGRPYLSQLPRDESSDPVCRLRNKMWLGQVEGAIAYSNGDLIAAESRFRDARRAWEENWGKLIGTCAPRGTSYKAEILLGEAQAIFLARPFRRGGDPSARNL